MKIFHEATGKMLTVHEVQILMAEELCKKFSVRHEIKRNRSVGWLLVYADEQVQNTPKSIAALRDIDDCVLDDGGKEFDRYIKEFTVEDLLEQINSGNIFQTIDYGYPEILENVLEVAQKAGIKLFVVVTDDEYNDLYLHEVKPWTS